MSDGSEHQTKRSSGQRRGGWRTERKTAIWLGIALVACVPIGLAIGFLTKNAAARMTAVFAIAIIAFLGILLLAHEVASYRPFETGEMRMAIAASFVIVYFAVLAIFLFSINTPTKFAQDYIQNLTTLLGVIIAFYFASSAAVQYAKIRSGQGAPGGSDASPSEPTSDEPSAATSARAHPEHDVPGQIAALRASIEALQASQERLAARVSGNGAGVDLTAEEQGAHPRSE